MKTYKVVQCSPERITAYGDELNAYAADGWKVISCAISPGGWLTVILEKDK